MIKRNIVLLVVLTLIIIIGALSINPIKHNIANKNLEKGIALYGESDFKNAALAFEKAISLNKNLVEAYINLAKTQVNTNQLDKAFSTAKSGMEINPNNAELLSICGEIFVKKEDNQGAIEFFDKAIEADSLLASAYYYRGVAKANTGQLNDALIDYKKAQELDLNNKEYYESSVLVRTELDDYQGIIKDYNKLLELDPENVEAFYQRGYFKFSLNDYNGALQDFNAALQIDKTLGKAHYYKGLSLVKSNDLEKGASSFEKAAKHSFKPDEAYFNEGLALLQLQQLTKAKKAFTNSISSAPNGLKSAEAQLNMGVVDMMQGNTQTALNTFNSLLLKKPKNTGALFNRAYINGSAKQYSKAIDDLSKCLELGDSTANVYYLRAAYLISLNKFDEGCSDAKKALDLGHPNAEELVNMYCSNKTK